MIKISNLKTRLFSSFSKNQMSLMENEFCILVDKNDHQIGTASKYTCHREPNPPLHRAFSIFLFNKDKLLLQQRSLFKSTFPGLWSNTCCSHPLVSDKSMKDAIKRKLNNELGITGLNDFTYQGKIIYSSSSGNGWAEHELDHLYFSRGDPKIKINSEEVNQVRWMGASELYNAINDKPGDFTPWFKKICSDFLLRDFSNWSLDQNINKDYTSSPPKN